MKRKQQANDVPVENYGLQWHTEQRRVIDLVPYGFNPRKLTDERKQKLIASLTRFNLAEIPAINTDNTIIAGHQRIKVLMELGRSEDTIDVRVPSRLLSEKELKEYNLSSNVQYGMWDIDVLEEIFCDIDLGAIGITPEELKSLRQAEQLNINEDESDVDVTIPLEPVTINGDIYKLVSLSKGISHRLLCGDFKTDTDKLMNGAVADIVFTDPPYNVKIDKILNAGKIKHEEFAEASGEMSEGEFVQFLRTMFETLANHSKNGSIHYVCMDWRHVFEITCAQRLLAGGIKYELKNICAENIIKSKKKHDYEQKDLCVWNKDNAGMGVFYRSKHELIFVFKHGKEKHTNNFEFGSNGRYRTNVWDYPSANSFAKKDNDAKNHPTPKPLDMVADALIDCSNKGEMVLDLFLGSGTTLIAAEKTARCCYATEIAPCFCDLSIRRWLKYMQGNNIPFTIMRNERKLEECEINEYLK
jgi:DNA modification methylase